ncbi:serine/threonine-protein kinase [Tuwongella immobilis]|uniref:Protein kinase domain-containing protein n=1 Tax=Tuwongella immobilis TaxID=692036 RepID=A0A6C2YU19_9BACT|nr:serine/threonine-protein kinase [Tuwongella immobilis]VIP04623.1 serine threonine protein kinase : Serine/threonine protein kinase OS=Planctomyces maris DSM 8797 GN=PM8797T_04085 PE=3 SV=1: Pkinase [Tuwongella immobilis]VTS06607.1 serine threonine protein kinase : Serine/threonine protein kinase OS=Planctomyces maris DSM 8797 GN=PM8797T_04085 PE=3 SV=1: Pkinase [Tuwongella immobilis]
MSDRVSIAQAIAEVARQQMGGDRAALLVQLCQGDLELQRQVEQLLKDAKTPPASPRAAAPAPKTLDAGIDLLPEHAIEPHGESTFVRFLRGHKPTLSPEESVATPSEMITLLPGVGQSDSKSPPKDHPYLGPASRADALGRLGSYEILSIIGAGGFGVVFRAFDEKLHRMVAIKAMHPTLAVTAEARDRFVREARAAAAIHQENVVVIYAVEENPVPFLVMECIQGQTLHQRIQQRGPLPIGEVLRLGMQIARGIAAAHAIGMIHRDIKPANILLDQGVEPRVKITDFGLARKIDDASITQSGFVVGTPMFMAPEQAQGIAVDTRADQFSLGSVLYTMVAGTPPFQASNTLAVLMSVATENHRPLAELRSEVPDWLAWLIDKLMAKRPEDRFANSQEMVAVFEELWADFKRAESESNGHMNVSVRRLTPIKPGTVLPPDENTQLVRREGARRRWSRFALTGGIILVASLAGAFLLAGLMGTRIPRSTTRQEGGNPNEPDVASLPQLVPLPTDHRPIIRNPYENLPQLPSIPQPTPGTPKRIPGTAEYRDWVAAERFKYQQMREAMFGATMTQLVDRFHAEFWACNPSLEKIYYCKIQPNGLPSITLPFDEGLNFGPLHLVLPIGELTIDSRPPVAHTLDLEVVRDLRIRSLGAPNFVKIMGWDSLASTATVIVDFSSAYCPDLEWTRNMPQLLNLSLRHDPTISLTPLYDQKTLQSLALRAAQPELRALRGLKITELDLWYWKGDNSTLDPLRGLDLRFLNLGGNPVFDSIACVESMPELRILHMNSSGVNDLAPVATLKNVWNLSFRDTKVASLEPLRNVSSLRVLRCDVTPVTDFSPLVGVPLQALVADVVPDRDAAILKKIPTLTHINGVPAEQFWKSPVPPPAP